MSRFFFSCNSLYAKKYSFHRLQCRKQNRILMVEMTIYATTNLTYPIRFDCILF